MAKEDVTFTIGADGRAMAGELGRIAESTKKALSDIGLSFMGLQGVVAGASPAREGSRFKHRFPAAECASAQRLLSC